jgi:hypothetical protein
MNENRVLADLPNPLNALNKLAMGQCLSKNFRG